MQLKIYFGANFALAALAFLLGFVVVHSVVYNVLSNAYLCINADFTVTYSDVSVGSVCAYLCDDNPRCQAFTIIDGPCQLFVFDKCSKSVKNCSCSRTGPVFMKPQPGMQPGALCPSGYTSDLCGVKYMMNSGQSNWQKGRNKCSLDGGFVIMADVTDTAELDKIEALYIKYGNVSFWVGGYQRPNSTEPDGGWYWYSCDINVTSSFFWGVGEPNNYLANENAMVRFSNLTKLSDIKETANTAVTNVLCECLSPFN